MPILALEKTPYPLGQRYHWLLPERPFTFTEVRALIKDLRECAPKFSPRWETYDLVLATIDALNHKRGVEEFPRPKVHKLLIAAAAKCGWYYRKYDKVGALGPSGTRYCPKCCEYKPTAAYRRKATDAERKKNGWGGEGRIRYMDTLYCKDCRSVQAKAKAAKSKRVEQRKAVRKLTKLIKEDKQAVRVVAERRALTYSVLKAKIDANIRQTKEVLAAENEAKQEFYLERLYCLEQAKAELERRIENGEPLPENNPADETPTPHWSRLLSEEDYRRLNDKYMTFVSSPGRKGRTPQI